MLKAQIIQKCHDVSISQLWHHHTRFDVNNVKHHWFACLSSNLEWNILPPHYVNILLWVSFRLQSCIGLWSIRGEVKVYNCCFWANELLWYYLRVSQLLWQLLNFLLLLDQQFLHRGQGHLQLSDCIQKHKHTEIKAHPKQLAELHRQENISFSVDPVQIHTPVCLRPLPSINMQYFSLWFSLQLNQ